MSVLKTLILHPHPCQASSLAIAKEVLETANQLARHMGVSHRFDLDIARPSGDLGQTDLVILPGQGLSTPRAFQTLSTTPEFADLVATLEQARQTHAVIAGACSGVYALGAAGLLDGHKATCPWWLAPYFQQCFPKAQLSSEDMILDQGHLITAGAAFSQIDLMLHLVQRFAGQALAEQCRRYLMADQRPSQGPYVSVSALIASDPQLQKAELFAQRHIATPLSIADLAAAAGLGERTFARRLKAVANMTPIGFLQNLRVTEAIRLAQTSKASTDEIAHRVGYSDASTLRRLVSRQMGKPLDRFRQQEQAGAMPPQQGTKTAF